MLFSKRNSLLGPTPPQDVKATSKDSSIKLSWTKPVLPILRFVKQFKIRIVEDKTIYAAFVNGDEFMLELSNCKPLTNYSFQLSTITSNELESQATEAIEMQTKGKKTDFVCAFFSIISYTCNTLKCVDVYR